MQAKGKTMIEHERSYVFTWHGARKFLESQDIPWPEGDDAAKVIDDYYLACGLRIRMSSDISCSKAVVTRKQGNKADGYHVEQEEEIPWDAAKLLAETGSLHVHKKRYQIPIDSSRVDRPNDANVKAILDLVERPMRIAVLEIEAVSESLYPLPVDICRRLFGVDLESCPLSTFEYFKRKIGICGAPSSGKSETASVIAHRVNTDFGGNAFHVAEFATTFIQKYHRNPTFQDQFFIWHGQKEREQDAESAGIVVSDCPTFLAYIYLMYLNREKFSPQVALYCSKLYKRALFDIENYRDLVFLQLQDQYADNNVRYQSKAEAEELERRILQFLKDHRIPFTTATCYEAEQIVDKLFWINHI
jgi:nicotinamide riboside kinase